MAGHSKARVYLRPMYPFKSKGPLPMVRTPIDIDLDELSKILGAARGRESMEQQFFVRLSSALCMLGYDLVDARDLIARELGWPSFDAISNSCIVKPEKLDLILARRKAQREHDERLNRRQEVEAIKRTRRAENHLSMRGRYSTMTAAEGQKYFFEDHPEYIKILENLMQDHTDEWMEVAITHYPGAPLEWDSFNKSFGAFWRKVLRFRTDHSGVFKEPGLEAIKRLALYLYSWNFRRYLTGPIILRHASYLSREFRANHFAIVRDEQRSSLTVDEEYTYSDVDDDDDDNIGNRI